MRLNSIFYVTAACLLTIAPGCDDDGTSVDSGPLELIGTWTDNFGGTTVITETSVNAATVVAFDNAENSLILQNPADDPFFPSLFSKVVWTDVVTETGLREHWQCTIAFGAATEAEAEATVDSANRTDLSGAGCGGFSWTGFRPALSIAGTWASNFGETLTFSPFVWGPASVARFDDAARWVVTQNAADDAFSPNTFNRTLWTVVADGGFYTCSVAFGLATVEEAVSDDSTADDTNPEVAGCGDFSWTRLSPPIAVAGDYTGANAADVTVTSFMWATYPLAGYDNTAAYAAVTESPTAPSPPNGVAIAPTYSRLKWQLLGDELTYCIAETGLATSAEALGTAADGADQAPVAPEPLTGCTDGPWTLTVK